MFQRSRHLFAVGLIAGATALAASAQTAPDTSATTATPATAAQPAHPGMKKERDPAKRFEKMQQRRTERLAALKDKLKLEAGQQSAWDSFAQAQQPPAPPQADQRMKREDFAKLTTPQRLDLMQKRQAEQSRLMWVHCRIGRSGIHRCERGEFFVGRIVVLLHPAQFFPRQGDAAGICGQKRLRVGSGSVDAASRRVGRRVGGLPCLARLLDIEAQAGGGNVRRCARRFVLAFGAQFNDGCNAEQPQEPGGEGQGHLSHRGFTPGGRRRRLRWDR